MERLFLSRQSRHPYFEVIISKSTFHYLYLDMAYKIICFPPGKGINRRNENTKRTIVNWEEPLLLIWNTDDITQYLWLPTFIFQYWKIKNDFSFSEKQSCFNRWSLLFPEKLATLKNRRKIAAPNKKKYEKHPWSNLEQSTNAPRSQEDYITQVFEDIAGRVTKKLS